MPDSETPSTPEAPPVVTEADAVPMGDENSNPAAFRLPVDAEGYHVPFRTGSPVRLKTGGPVMTCGAIYRHYTFNQQVPCAWHEGKALQSQWFVLGTLKVVSPEEAAKAKAEQEAGIKPAEQTPKEPNPFKTGDYPVQLKSGGPLMTLGFTAKDYDPAEVVKCMYFEDGKKPITIQFFLGQLKKVEPKQD